MIEDKKISSILDLEKKRQIEGIELIASENYVSESVLECMGSILTNKYSEGYPEKRYYCGNQYIDEIENEAIARAKELFGAEHVNVQPYSGSPANQAVYMALINPGDTVMGMALDAGGHLTHGYKVSFSGKYYNSVNYGVDAEGYIDYAGARKIALEHSPKLIWAGFSAYSRIIDWNEFRKIADEVGAYLAVDIAHVAGLVAVGAYPSPVGIADVVTTTTHKTLRGPRGALIMCKEELGEKIDKAVFPGLQGGPHNHTTAGIAVALGEALKPEFKGYAKQIILNAKALASEMMNLGYFVISGGTDNHLFLVDTVRSVNLSGREVADILEQVNITLNKNAIPNDSRKPWDPSGIRIGTPAITTRGMKEEDMKVIAYFIDSALKGKMKADKIREEVKDFTKDFPIPGINSI
jgi:glycine hydroxymethyltransferase